MILIIIKSPPTLKETSLEKVDLPDAINSYLNKQNKYLLLKSYKSPPLPNQSQNKKYFQYLT